MKNFKDNLKGTINVGVNKCYSINEVLRHDYDRFKGYGEGYELATYRGTVLSLDIECEKMFNSMDLDFNEEQYKGLSSLYSNIYMQVEQINQELDGE